MKTEFNDKCENCGATYGLHHFETIQCPSGGFEAPIGQKQMWAATTFKPPISKQEEQTQANDGSHTIAGLRNKLITGNFMISDGMKQPTSWEQYALKLEDEYLSLKQANAELVETVRPFVAFPDEDLEDWGNGGIVTISVSGQTLNKLWNLLSKHDKQ